MTKAREELLYGVILKKSHISRIGEKDKQRRKMGLG